VQKFMSVTNHVYTANPVVISKKVWDKLSPAEQAIVRDAAIEAGAFQRKLSREASSVARKELESKGMLVNDVPPATLAKMQDLTRPVAEKFAASYDATLVKLYRAEMERVRAAVR
jgi:TRAP-type C4-dicarboxylate transport system substrate-binding protein